MEEQNTTPTNRSDQLLTSNGYKDNIDAWGHWSLRCSSVRSTAIIFGYSNGSAHTCTAQSRGTCKVYVKEACSLVKSNLAIIVAVAVVPVVVPVAAVEVAVYATVVVAVVAVVVGSILSCAENDCMIIDCCVPGIYYS